MNFQEYVDADMMAIDLANILADELSEALHHEDRVLFAVPGGSTPAPVFDDLCAADIDWSRVDVVPTDERWVPEDHERSNALMIKERLLVNRAAAARFIPLFTPAHTPEEVLPELESMLTPELPIAVALIGMGPDMHTASMFPGADGLETALDSHAPILVPIRRDDLPDTRITLSARILGGAVSKHLVITGEDKRDALKQSRHLTAAQAPVRRVLSGATVHWAKS